MSASEQAGASTPPPSVLRVVWLIVALEGRRWLNRRPFKRRSAAPSTDTARTGTARKGAPAKLLLAVVSGILALNVANNTTRMVHRIAVAAERADARGMALVSAEALTWLDGIASHTRPQGTFWRSEQEQRAEVFDYIARTELNVAADEQAARVRELEQIYATRGRAGFRETRIDQGVWPSERLWYHGGDPRTMLTPLALIGFLLALSTVLLSVVGSDRDLARSDASLEWWFSFPVPTRGLLLARLLGTGLVHPLAWLLLLPFFFVVFWCAGLGPWLGFALALLATLYVCLLGGSARVATETTLRRLLRPQRVAHVQAGLELFGSIPLILAIAASNSRGIDYLIGLSRSVRAPALYNPLSLPLTSLLGGLPALWIVSAALLVLLGSVYGAVVLGSLMLRDGLVSASEPVVGSRTRVVSSGGSAQSLLSVVARRELLAVVRDPTRIARVLLFPLGSIAMFALTDPGLFRAIVSEPQHAGAAAFFVGAFVLVGGGLVTLANEGPGLWLLYTAPHSLDAVLLRRAVVWSALAMLVSTLMLGVLAFAAHDASFIVSGYAALALVGIALHGFISVALGALGTDVLESARPRRLQPFVPQLFMLLTGMFAFALYSPSLWAKFAQLCLSTLLCFALWQKLRDHTPYLLDPTEAPPPSIAVSDGIFAVLAFFVLQGVFGALFSKLGMSPGVVLTFSFSGAGLLASLAALYSFHRLGVPELWRAVGLVSETARRTRAPLWGVLGGLTAGAVALLYARALERIDWLQRIYEQTEKLDPSDEQRPWLAGLAILAAPLFEEFIFRGVLFRGFRRSLGPASAVLASALVFAIVHPPLSFAPVFVMALFAGGVFERTGSLLAPIMTHMTYNAIVVGSALLAGK